MNMISRIILVVLAIFIGGGAVFLATWDIPAPSAPIEKVIPNEQVLR